MTSVRVIAVIDSSMVLGEAGRAEDRQPAQQLLLLYLFAANRCSFWCAGLSSVLPILQQQFPPSVKKMFS